MRSRLVAPWAGHGELTAQATQPAAAKGSATANRRQRRATWTTARASRPATPPIQPTATEVRTTPARRETPSGVTSRALGTLPRTAMTSRTRPAMPPRTRTTRNGRWGAKVSVIVPCAPVGTTHPWAQPSTVTGLSSRPPIRACQPGMKFSRTMSSPSDPARVASSSARSVDPHWVTRTAATDPTPDDEPPRPSRSRERTMNSAEGRVWTLTWPAVTRIGSQADTWPSRPAINACLVVLTSVAMVAPLSCTVGPKPQGTTMGALMDGPDGHSSPTSATSPMTTGIGADPRPVTDCCRVVATTAISRVDALRAGRETSPSRSTSRVYS